MVRGFLNVGCYAVVMESRAIMLEKYEINYSIGIKRIVYILGGSRVGGI